MSFTCCCLTFRKHGSGYHSQSSSSCSTSSSSRGWLSQSFNLHKSVHFKPFDRQTHCGSLQDLAHLQASSSKTASGAGFPSIQSIAKSSLPLVVSSFQPFPLGLGIIGLLSRQFLAQNKLYLASFIFPVLAPRCVQCACKFLHFVKKVFRQGPILAQLSKCILGAFVTL